MTRDRISTKQRVAIFQMANGECHICNRRIKPGEGWDVSHPIPLAIGGPDDDSNRRPAHRKCHREHTAKVDLPRIAKTKRQHAAFIGAKVRSPGFHKAPPQRRASKPLSKWYGWKGSQI